MVWKKSDGTIVSAGRSWVDDNKIRHPSNWMVWSDEDKKGFGLTWEDDVDTSFDDRFYFAKGVEKSLVDIDEVDDDGNPILDPQTGKQAVTLGLKSIWIIKTKKMANNSLSQTDWYVTRKAETDTAIPSDISKYRTDVKMDFVSNGIKMRNDSGFFNHVAGNSFIYMAFAEAPFKYANGR